VTGKIQNYSYNFDPVSGNLKWRTNIKYSGLTDSLQYDNLDRLSTVSMGGKVTLNMGYDANKGGITTKSDAGTLIYNDPTHAYAISSVNPTTGLIQTPQSITYTSFECVSTISENNYSASFLYNSDNQRAQMVVQQNSSTILTRWYPTGNYIKENAGGVTKEYTFIGGDSYSAPIVAITQSGTTTYYDILRDYLGNITHVVNATTGVVTAEYSYDAWGRMRNPSTWVNYAPGSEPALFIAGRGFTGHEHLPWFNLINMNGRVYDPLLGMFLSADNYVQNPALTQNFNRYGYCLNNPLRYFDPSGYTWLSHFTRWMGDNWQAVATVAAFVAVAFLAPIAVAAYWAGSYAINLVGYNMINNHMSLKEAFRQTPFVVGMSFTIPYHENKPPTNNYEDSGSGISDADLDNLRNNDNSGLSTDLDYSTASSSLEPSGDCIDNGLLYPVSNSYIVTSNFTTGNRSIPGLGISGAHNGIDIACPIGTPVQSVYSGTVTDAEMDPSGRAGNYVRIDHDYYYNGGYLSTGYAHLSRITVSWGEYVNGGDIIGYSGNSGCSPNGSCYGAHLHFVTRINRIPFNPLNLFNYGH